MLRRALKALAKFACYRVLGLILRSRRRRQADLSVAECRRVLLCEISLLGDVVSFTASLGTVRKLWPGARIDVLVLRELAALFSADPRVDRAIPLLGMGGPAFAKTVRAVRRRRYDVILSMSPGVRNAAVALLGGGRAAAGYLVDRAFPPHYLNAQRIESAGIRLSRSITVPRGCHIADRGLKVLAALGADVPTEGAPELFVTKSAAERVRLLLDSEAVGEKPFAALHSSAGEQTRRWPVVRFAELARRLHDELGLAIVWVGALKDRALVAEAGGLAERRSVAFVGRPVDELAALVRRASLFVGNDSGPMHVAGAVGTPLVGIFGPGDPARLLPRNANAVAVDGRSPAGDVRTAGVDEVMAAAKKAVAAGRVR